MKRTSLRAERSTTLEVTTFGAPASKLVKATPAKAATPAPYYLRMNLADKPGALAKVATVLGDAGISIDRMRQYGQHSDSSVPVLVVTHKTTPEAIDYAIEALPRTGVLVSDPVELRIEEV